MRTYHHFFVCTLYFANVHVVDNGCVLSDEVRLVLIWTRIFPVH